MLAQPSRPAREHPLPARRLNRPVRALGDSAGGCHYSPKSNPPQRLRQHTIATQVEEPLEAVLPGKVAYVHAKAQGGLNVNTSTDRGMTPLATACAAGQFRLAHRLLSLGADCNVGMPTRPTETLVHVALRACMDMGTQRLAANTRDDEYSHYLLGRDKAFNMVLGLVHQLINKGVAVDATDSNQQTALHIATSISKLSLIKFLLRKGANPGMQDAFGAVPLDLVKRQSPDDVRFMAAQYRPLLAATKAALGIDSDTRHLTDHTGRMLFRLSKIHTAQATSSLLQQG
ncbi:putative calcium/calmodulin-dependent protein kinase type 1B [Colletotrichum sublineola]|uniref:Putative calcium/calmodulin-dependent protein kinase type 1B n=1 Tax=Colletotrichum sublineola TaxID=1173701 RepID=A0A066XL77_COLSU|nr:putative calcium/calmodulin-dependent protein kinase type 1B [Colletotrichum sublineola]